MAVKKEILPFATTRIKHEGIILIRQRKAITELFHSYGKSKKAKLIETENRFVASRGRVRLGMQGDEEMLVYGYKFPVIRRISSGYLRYSMVKIINNTVLYS